MKKWMSLALKLAPIVLIGVPGMPSIIVPLIVNAIAEAEDVVGATGAQKKTQVLEAVSAGIAAVNGAKGSEVVDPAIVGTIVAPAIDTTIGVINVVHKAQAPKPTP